MSAGIPLTIRVLYSCPLCGLFKVSCDVPARGEEDVVAWMHQTVAALSRDHHARSPRCQPRELKDVMIPMAGRDRIGGPEMN